MSEQLTPPEVKALRSAQRELQRARATWRLGLELMPARLAYRLPVNAASADMREYLQALQALMKELQCE